MLTRSTYRVRILVALLLAIAQPAPAQESDSDPCCTITAFDRRTGLVTASDPGSGQSFQFIAAPSQRRSLEVGQKVWANFETQKVAVDNAAPCCSMVNVTPATTGAAGVQRQVKPAEPAGAAGGVQRQVRPSEPCCGITSVNTKTGLVTATDKTSGRVFQFQVTDAALIRTLKTGQSVAADFGAGKVTIHGGAPCCFIVTAAPRP